MQTQGSGRQICTSMQEQQEEGEKEHFCVTTNSESRALALGDLAVLSHPTHIRK